MLNIKIYIYVVRGGIIKMKEDGFFLNYGILDLENFFKKVVFL
jgi:hypothetical protein